MPKILYCCTLVLILSCRLNEYSRPVFGISELNHANRTLLETVMTDGFSPPVASRVYVYPHLAHYITYSIFYPTEVKDISKIIFKNFLKPEIKQKFTYDPELTSLLAFCYTAKILVFSEYKMDELANQFVESARKKGVPESVINHSSQLAKDVTTQIQKRIQTDQYKETRTMDRFTSTKLPGKWKETPPDYLSGLEPHWSKITPLVIDSATVYTAAQLPEFSTKVNSAFYKMAMDVYEKSKKLTEAEIESAWFWDDNPNSSDHFGHSMAIIHKISPPGHWLNIIAQISTKENFSLSTLTKLYCFSSIAMFDGIISCWHEKYKTNSIRPITYIQEHIDPEWTPLIQTPPFPEYTSGHSVISAASAEVLTQLLGENFQFSDSTQTMFDMPARQFKNFHEAAWEVSMSRYFGGIHFRQGIEEGNKQGKYIAQLVLKKLNDN